MTARSAIKVLDVRWFSPGHWVSGGNEATVGIVCVEMDDPECDEPGRRVTRYFIGTGFGRDARSDQLGIAEWGAVFPQHVGAVLFGRVLT